MSNKFAIRITDGQTSKLFAVVPVDGVIYYRWLAKKSFDSGPNTWITAGPWAPEFDDIDYPL